MPTSHTPSSRGRLRSSLAMFAGLAILSGYLAIVPTAIATPASGPGAVSAVAAGALAPGTIPDGTCRARVTATGGGGASSPTANGFGGIGGAGATVSGTFEVLPLQTYQGSVGGGGANPAGGTGDGVNGAGGDGGTIVVTHRGGGGGGRTTVDLGGSRAVVAGGGGGGGGAHQVPPTGAGGGGGFAGIGAGVVAPGTNGTAGFDSGITANGGAGGQSAAGGAGGTNSSDPVRNGAAGGGIASGTGGNGGPDANYDSGGGGGGGYTGGGGGSSTVNESVTGAGGGGGSSWVAATSPVVVPGAPTSITGAAGTASPSTVGPGATGAIAIDWMPCLYGLTITKAVSSPAVNAGDSVTWTVSVTNNGPDPMTRGDTVDIADLLPAGPNGGPAPAFEVTSLTVSGGTNLNMSRGTVTCTGVTVGSSMPTSTVCSRPYAAPGAPQAPSGGDRGIDPGETITIVYEQIIANTAPCGTITNTATTSDRATATGTTDTVGVTATRTANEPLTIDCYDLAIVKTASPAPEVQAGGTITWSITVTNNGPADMEGPVATDPNPLVVTDAFPSGGVGSPILVSSVGPAGACNLVTDTITCASGLPAGGQQVLTFAQSVDGGTSAGTVISNTASVSDPTTGDSNDSSTDQTTVAAALFPELTLAKTATPTTYAAVGDVIDYDYLVTNTGTIPLDGPVTVSDDRETVTCPAVATVGDFDAELDLGEVLTCTASHTITQADIDAGSITNTASASADGVTSADDTATVTAVVGPGLSLVKTATPTTYGAVGDVIDYDYLVTNTGNVSLDGPVTVSDDRVTVTCPGVGSLDPGDDVTCTASHTITQADIDAGSITNTASASADGVTSADDTATVTAVVGPGLSLVKTATPTTYGAVGDVIDYDYLVTNTGNVSLDGPVTVSDDRVTVTCPGVGSLDPGDDVTCTASHTITQADIDAGSITNTASASADGVTSADDTATVTAVVGPGLSLVKTATSGYEAVGDVVTYDYLVSNTGNVTLAGPVTVSDDKVTVTCPAVGSLDPGDDVTCSSSYTITQADIVAGSITNVATASAGGVDSSVESETVTQGAAPPTPTPTGTAAAVPTAPPTNTSLDAQAGSPSTAPGVLAGWLVLAFVTVLIGAGALRVRLRSSRLR